MVYFYGNEAIKERLKDFRLTNDIASAKCAVIEMPGGAEVLLRAVGIPVFVVITGMLTFAELKLTKQSNVKIVQPEKLAIEVAGVEFGCLQNEDNDCLIFDEEEPPLAEKTTPAPEEKVLSAPGKKANTPEQTLQPIKVPPLAPLVSTSPLLLRTNHRRAPIAVSFSSEGGVGKTFVASNMACYVSLAGIPTVAVDLDMGYGDLDTAVGLVDPNVRTKVIDKKAKVPENGWVTVSDWRRYAVNLKQNILQHNSGLYVIPAYPYAGSDISESEIEDLLYTVSESFGFVVADLGVDGFSPHARVALRMADVVMLVGGQSEKTIGKISHFLKQEGGYSNKMCLVINKVSPLGYYTPGEVANTLGFEERHEIPMDERGVNSAKKQRKLAVQLPGSVSGEAIKDYAAILPFNFDSNIRVKQKSSLGSKLRSIFKRGR